MSQLFSENLGKVKDDEELEALCLKYPQYDRAYVLLATGENKQEARKWIEILWHQFERYADRDFINSFRKRFSQRSWELYLGVSFLNKGFLLGSHSDVGPDFDVKQGNDRIAFVEAVSATRGEGSDQVPSLRYDGSVQDLPETKMILRITNSLNEKYNQYLKHCAAGLISESDPYIIALNRSELDHFDPGLPLALKALYGVGYLTFPINPLEKDSLQKSTPFWSRRELVEKLNKSEVGTTFFEDKSHEGISAVIYSTDSILNVPRTPGEMGENFHIIHNKFAKNPILVGIFPFGGEYGPNEEGDIVKLRDAAEWASHRNSL